MLALKNLFRRKIRTSLTIVGVAVGVACVVTLVAVTRGMRGQFDEFFSAGDAHLVVTRRGAADPYIAFLPDEILAELSAREEVVRAHPILMGAVQIPQNPFFFVFGTTPASPFLENFRIVEGASMFAAESVDDRPGILIGKSAAEHQELSVGSEFKLVEQTYVVAGVYESDVAFLDAGGILAFADAQREASLEGKVSSVMLEVSDFRPEVLTSLEAELEEAFPKVEATQPAQFTAAFQEFETVQEAVTVLSLLAMLVGGIGVMNTMLMSVFERTREIGVLQAIGWSKLMIVRQILAEAAVVCLLGGPLGIVGGMAGIAVIASIGEFAWLTGKYDADLLWQAMAVGLGMGLLGAAYPTWRATQIAPIEALRYE